MFDFNNHEKKTKYYNRAETFLKENNLDCFVVDRTRFGVMKNTYARIDVEPFSKKTVTREDLKRAKDTKPFVVINDRYSRNPSMLGRPLRENAYLLFELDMEDR